mmetsp:Transcript_6172/g.10091  ORF Transcript_6172/g.10091 Transcript_6172/m.10091 type:complete len:358 (-) Transcript_6172:49-1122(-)
MAGLARSVRSAASSCREPSPACRRLLLTLSTTSRLYLAASTWRCCCRETEEAFRGLRAEEEEEEEGCKMDRGGVTSDDDDNDDDSDDETEEVTPAQTLPTSSSEGSQALPHIMISYCWAHQEVIIEICQHLKAAGLTYWLDIEQMHGEINDRMAEAIESCGVVIVGVSSKYKLSANCRMEAEYSNTSGKVIIPLMMEKGYRANGWLGLLIAGKLWYGVSPDDANRQANIACMVDVVNSALVKEAAVMSPECLARSLALFDTSSQENPPTTGIVNDGQQSDHIASTESTTFSALKEGSGPALYPLSGGGLTLDAVSLLINQMQVKLQANIVEQLSPIVDSLSSIESRLDNIESNMKKL